MIHTEELLVERVVDEGDRVVIYDLERPWYKIIANEGTRVQVGDRIRYEPYGVNFGFFTGWADARDSR